MSEQPTKPETPQNTQLDEKLLARLQRTLLQKPWERVHVQTPEGRRCEIRLDQEGRLHVSVTAERRIDPQEAETFDFLQVPPGEIARLGHFERADGLASKEPAQVAKDTRRRATISIVQAG